MRILRLNGSPYDVGFQHGQKLRELIAGYYSYCRMILHDPPENTVKEVLYNVEEGLRRAYPEALEEMRGIADGSRLDYDQVLLLNFTSEVRSQLTGGCTGFTAVEAATKSTHPIMGKTRDMGSQLFFPFQIGMKIQSSTGTNVFLAEAFSGMAVTGCGMNEHGLGLALNIIISINDVDNTIGVQRAFLARLILEQCTNVQEALKCCSHHDTAYQGVNFLLCDRYGDSALIEKSHCHQVIMRGKDGVLASTNYFQHPAMQAYSSIIGQSSKARLDRITALLQSNRGHIDLALAKKFLRDHNHGLDNYSICRHTPTRANTVQAYILEPRSNMVYIADGHPCQSRFHPYAPF
jgi:isopenicillin-N N-acyltransferase-like protein